MATATEIVRALFEAFNDGDLDQAVSDAADGLEFVDVAAGQSFRGGDGLRQWLQAFLTALPNGRTELISVFGQGNLVATEHIGRGTHDGPFVTPAGTIPPTGRAVELRFAELFEVEGGKIIRMSAYYDSATMMRQLGLLPRSGSLGERSMTGLMSLGVKARRRLHRRNRQPESGPKS